MKDTLIFLAVLGLLAVISTSIAFVIWLGGKLRKPAKWDEAAGDLTSLGGRG